MKILCSHCSKSVAIITVVPMVVGENAERMKILDYPWVRSCDFDDLLNLIASNYLPYIPPTRVNLAEVTVPGGELTELVGLMREVLVACRAGLATRRLPSKAVKNDRQ